jgi:hypothetical protein
MDDSEALGATIRAFLEAAASGWRPWRIRRKKKRTLRKLLLKDDRFAWRTTEALQNSIAADRRETEELLIQIGARKSGDKQDLWTLKKS